MSKRSATASWSNCSSLLWADISTRTKLVNVKSQFMSGCTNLRFLHTPPSVNRRLRIESQFLYECRSLEFVDVPFVSDLSRTVMLEGCTPPSCVIHAIVMAHSGFRPTCVPKALHDKVVVVEPGHTLPLFQWSWKDHSRHPHGVRLGVLWMFAGLQHQAAKHETRNIPGEVAYEICRYIGTPFDELLTGPAVLGGTDVKEPN